MAKEATFEVGEKVICINDAFPNEYTANLVKGEIYTIDFVECGLSYETVRIKDQSGELVKWNTGGLHFNADRFERRYIYISETSDKYKNWGIF